MLAARLAGDLQGWDLQVPSPLDMDTADLGSRALAGLLDTVTR